MKKIILITFLFYVKIFSQESNASIELYFGTENASGGGITFTVTNQSQVWGVEYPVPLNCIGWEYYKTSAFNIGEYEVTNHNQPMGAWKGLEFVSSQDNSGFYDIYGYGLYKITTSESNANFYIDYRDQRIGCYPTTANGHLLDLWIKYDASNNVFSYNTDGQSNGTFYSISNGQYFTMWEIKNVGTPETSELPDFWDYALALIPSQSGNHPKLVWGPHPTLTDVVGYRVYRKYGTTNFVPIKTTDYDEYYYNDTELTLEFQQGGTNAYYYVKAIVIHESESEATNTVAANIDGQSPEKQISSKNIIYDFQINNYPNPFNPTTTISYTMQERSKIVIKVYDMLGREIKELVNETKDEGTYQVKFNADPLSSGVYIYTIIASNGSNILYRESKQMILMK